MADFAGSTEQKHPNLNLSSEEQRLYNQVFSAADSDSIGVVTGDVALRFLPEKTRLASEVLGEIWQIADVEDKGFLTPPGFYIVLRLIGYAQAGRNISAELALKPGGPLPRVEGINTGPAASPLQAQGSGGPIRVPPLAPEKANQYAALFQQSGAQNGTLPGTTAKQIFDRAQLPNDILVRIWNLADTEQRGMLSETEFIIAMHLLASHRSGSLRALPHNLPAGLYEAAARRGAPPRPLSGSRQPPMSPASAISRQFSGSSAQRPSSPLARQPYTPATMQPQATGATSDWIVTAQEKAQYDGQFDNLDTARQGFVSGEQAVGFFSNSRLPEDDLAQIWDLADIRSEGQLNKDEFAVAMYLIRQQLARRGPLPTTLPANLVPPSMRPSAPQQQAQATGIASQAPPPKAKSAAEDLFGLDALSAPSAPSIPATQVPQSTGGSSAPQTTQSSASPQAPLSQSTTFKPFIPSSSFGQSIVSPQPTGTSQSSMSRAPPSNNDDLLGDTDPEVNKRITNETTELANLSNQVGTLTNQMQEVKNKRGGAEQNMSQVNAQKKDFETRLSQLRSAYESEARDLRSLEDKLAAARNESKKVQADLSMVQHSYTNLLEQKQQIVTALEADQKENASLKERMRQVNAEIGQLKPQIEKARSDARQQKGLVAINKKQLSTIEAERDRAKSDLEGANNEYQEATKELEDSTKNIEQQKSVSPIPAASPAPSTTSQSTNPFFRRTTTGTSQQESARSPFAPESATSPNHSAFDSFFGSAMPAPSPFSPPSQAPPTSFGVNQSENAPTQIPPNDIARSGTASPAIVEPKTPTQHDLPPSSQLPPPPPQSRQITSSSLPLREAVAGPASESSSVGVAPPASRFGGTSGSNTPTTDRQVSSAGQGLSFSPLSQVVSDEGPRAASSQGQSSGFVTPQESGHIPGSFPGEETVTTPVAGGSQSTEAEDPFTLPASTSKEPSSAKDDFDSAFAGFDTKGKAPETAAAFTQSKAPKQDEFPPIQEFENDDDDSSSESDKGFDDNFAPHATSHTATEQKEGILAQPTTGGQTEPNTTESAPSFLRSISASSSLPTPNAQASPPTYEQTVPAAGTDGTRKDSNQFPAEYTGLLPSRDDPTSPEITTSNPDNAPQLPADAQASGTAVYSPPNAGTPAPEHDIPASVVDTKPVAPPKNAFDDFDNAFGDLSEAKAADDKGDDDFGTHRDNNFFDEFNPTFDSPAPSKATTSSAFQDNAFHDFEPSMSSSAYAGAPEGATSQPAANTDWDSMFAGLGDSNTQTNGSASQHLAPANNGLENTGTKPSLARALSTGTEHDDPILKRLTAMGYPRDESLAALEKFDYNLDKAADYLTSKA